MPLELTSLQKAVGSLERAIAVSERKIVGSVDTDEEEVLRAGVIQNFEFTYELCWKFMRRWLETNGAGPEADGWSRKELFRHAAESRLIEDPALWFGYHNARNETSHTYEATRAEDVYQSALRFLKDAQLLLKNLQTKND